MTKRYFLAGDVHDDVEALAAFARYAQVQEADGILFNGDFSLRPYTSESLDSFLSQRTPQGISSAADTFIGEKRTHNEATINEMKNILDQTQIDYFVVPGNYDPKLSNIFGEREIHRTVVNLDQARLLGYGGSDAFPQHIQLLVQLGEVVSFDHQELYRDLKLNSPTIALIHNPPRDLCDTMFNGQNVGTIATTQYIIQASPKLIISGHIHESGPLGNNPSNIQGVAKYDNPQSGKRTVVVNPGNLGRFEVVEFPSLQANMQFPFGTFADVELESDGTPIRLRQYTLTGPEGKGNIGKVEKIADYNLNEA